jgi:hypothetical protein
VRDVDAAGRRPPLHHALGEVLNGPRRLVLEVVVESAEVGEVVECSAPAVLPIDGVVHLAAGGASVAAGETARSVANFKPAFQVCRRVVCRAVDIKHRARDRMGEDPRE